MEKKNTKIAMMTWYHYRNLGTALQVCALYKTISDLGYMPSLVQYRPKVASVQKLSLKTFCSKALHWCVRKLFGPDTYCSEKREKLFTQFLSERISETTPRESGGELAELNSEFAAFVCGSDQIWSPLCFDPKYFLSFVSDEKRMVAYAPSFGTMRIAEENIKKETALLLRRFHHLSVRELQGTKIIKDLTGQDAKVVIDPTLLLSASEWDAYAEVAAVEKIKEPYILCYFLGKPSHYRKYVHCLGKKWGIRAYEIPILRDGGRYAKFPFEVGPGEFVSLVRNASFVCTDSFHGMAFAINYHVPFAVFERFIQDDPRNQNSRIYSLLELLGIEERLVSPKRMNHLDELRQLDYSEIEERLQQLRQESMNYLEDSLNLAVAGR